MEICFATNNKKKLEEVKAALSGKDIRILSLEEIGCREELAETGNTLDDNAFQKARYVNEKYKISCFADDTGLEVEALDGEPGVYSGRYAGEPRSDERNIQLLLDKLDGEAHRKARFRTVIALILEGKEYSFEGTVEGEITEVQIGSGGFGYDSVFRPQGYDRTFAQLNLDEKNEISHRGIAVRKLIAFLAERDSMSLS